MQELTIELPLSITERDQFLALPDLHEALRQRIEQSDLAKPTIPFAIQELNYLASAVAHQASRTRSPGRRRVLDAVVHRIALTIRQAAHDCLVMAIPGLAEFITERTWSDVEADARSFVSDAYTPATFNPQPSIDRERAQLLQID